jgi:hypothetical protein
VLQRWAMLQGRLSVLILVSGALSSCGGSSSETPPPLEPHPLNLHYSREATTLGNEIEAPVIADAGASQPKAAPEDEAEEVVPVAPRTWGSDKPKNK